MTLFWRMAFLLVVFGNLLFYAWSQGYLGRLEDGREPQRTGHQLAAEKLRILAATDASADTSAAPAAASAASALATPVIEMACRLVGGNELSAADAQRLFDRVQSEAENVADAEDGAEVEANIKLLELAPRYWVHFRPLPSRAHVDRKLQELKRLGITDAMPMLAEGEDRFAISLGMFSTPEAAANHLAAMQQRGVRTAVIEPRSRATGKAQVEIHGTQTYLQQRLPKLLNELGLGRIQMANCPNAADTDTPAAAPPPSAAP
ncbi:MAG: hypothetical protein KUL75_07730 [Sterolibacterium sp.]|nr:hypothetical protein [Sterolibacterium sp.]